MSGQRYHKSASREPADNRRPARIGCATVRRKVTHLFNSGAQLAAARPFTG